jgi:hypothetical protein
MTRASDRHRKLAGQQRADAALEQIYAALPELACAGHCTESCGPIDMTVRERERIRARGVRISPPEVAVRRVPEFRCEALTEDGRCGVYDVRPLICRLWGLTDSMPCPWGCVPVPRRLTDAEAGVLITEALIAGGHSILHDVEPGEARRAAQVRGGLIRPEIEARSRQSVPPAFRPKR